MRHLIFLAILLQGGSTPVVAQINIDKLDYESVLYKFDTNPYEYANIIISDKVLEIVNDRNTADKAPTQYFIKAVYYLNKGDQKQSEYWLDQILSLSTDSICDKETDISDKLYCAKFIRHVKAFALKYQILELFKEGEVNTYCNLYQQYKNDIHAEEALFNRKVTGSNSHGTDIFPIFWDAPLHTLNVTFIEHDCLALKKDYQRAFEYFKMAISNTVWHYPESQTIQKEVSKRIALYVIKTTSPQETKQKLKQTLRDFKKNAEPMQGKWYKYQGQVFDVPITLQSSTATQSWTPKQQSRINKGKPPVTKRQIIRAYKKTLYHKALRGRKVN